MGRHGVGRRPTARCTRVKDDVSTAFKGRENKTRPVIRVLPKRPLDVLQGVLLFHGNIRSLDTLLLRSDTFFVCVGIWV